VVGAGGRYASDGWQAARRSAKTSNMTGRATILILMDCVFIFVNDPFRRNFILINVLNTKTLPATFWFPKEAA
jgi:hypothetical protein